MTPEEIRIAMENGTLLIGLTDKGRARLKELNIKFNREADLERISEKIGRYVLMFKYEPTGSVESLKLKQSLCEAATEMLTVLTVDDDSTR